MTPFWSQVTGAKLAQGDLLEDCLVPIFHREYGSDHGVEEVPVSEERMIVVTQSCDLAAGKTELVALCPIHRLEEFETVNPKFQEKGI